MEGRSQIGRSVILNWIAFAASISIAFFLSPFIVNRLGNVGYGVWTLINSMIAYMGFMDLGLRGAVTRFVARHHAQADHEGASRSVSAAFWLRIWIGFVIVAISLILPRIATSIFAIPQEMQRSASWAIIATGISFGITITFGVFGGVLAALQRFDVMNAVSISQTFLRAVGIVFLLRSGYGIVALALWELGVVVLANTALVVLTFWVYPKLRIHLRKIDLGILRQLWGYSFYILLMNVCWQVIQYTDNVIVGAFVSVAAVAYCAIAVGLFEYTRQAVGALGMVFLPLASSLDAQGRQGHLRELLIQGTSATLLIALPIQLVLFFCGRTFIGLWIGEQYAEVSGRLLQILLVAQVFTFANYASHNIALGLGKQKPVAARVASEAVAKLVLSIILVRQIGLDGIAWGSVIPSVIVQTAFWPRYICKMLDVSVYSYLWQSWVRPVLAMVPFGLACYLVNRYWVPANLLQFILHITIIMPICLIGMALCFRKMIFEELRRRFGWFVRPSTDSALPS